MNWIGLGIVCSAGNAKTAHDRFCQRQEMRRIKNEPDKNDRNAEEKWKYLELDPVQTACATEMTGLMYRAPEDEDEEDSYEEIYPYLPPEENE